MPEVISSFLPLVFFLHLVVLQERTVEFLRNSLVCSIHGRARLAMEGKSVLPMHRGPFVDMGEVCLKWADNLWYVGSASHKLCLATYGPIVEY